MNIREAVAERLKIFKVELKENNDLKFLIKRALSNINNITNQDYTLETLPRDIEYILIDKIVGEFLNFKKLNGELENLDFTSVIKSIKEGDTTETYSDKVKTAEELFDDMVADLLSAKDNELYRFSRIVW